MNDIVPEHRVPETDHLLCTESRTESLPDDSDSESDSL